jgi:CheY-like chemotaxis protein
LRFSKTETFQAPANIRYIFVIIARVTNDQITKRHFFAALKYFATEPTLQKTPELDNISGMNLSRFSDQPTVLVVDDNIDNLVLMECQLAAVTSCTVITADTGKAALRLAQYQLPDLILLDILLPDLSGIEVTRQLRQATTTAKIPIVALTALASAEERDRILNAGCNDYLSKPYDLDDLEEIVTHHLPHYSLL